LCQAGGDQVFHHLLLTIHHNRAPAGQVVHIDAVAFARELQVEAVMHQPFAPHPRPKA
jgi:uncharacterized membrane protein (DUF373 family)